jgi:predicted RNase H-like nuclease
MFAFSERSSHKMEQNMNAKTEAAAVPSAESPFLTAFFRISSFEIMTLTKRCESVLTRNRTMNEAMNIDVKTMRVDSEKPPKSSLE